MLIEQYKSNGVYTQCHQASSNMLLASRCARDPAHAPYSPEPFPSPAHAHTDTALSSHDD